MGCRANALFFHFCQNIVLKGRGLRLKKNWHFHHAGKAMNFTSRWNSVARGTKHAGSVKVDKNNQSLHQ